MNLVTRPFLYLIAGAVVGSSINYYKENISGLKEASETRDCEAEHAKQEYSFYWNNSR